MSFKVYRINDSRPTLAEESARVRFLFSKWPPPDTRILASQWASVWGRRNSYTDPLQRLAVALIDSALRDYALPKHHAIAAEWLRSFSDRPFSLRWVCDALGLDFGRTQARLLRLALVKARNHPSGRRRIATVPRRSN